MQPGMRKEGAGIHHSTALSVWHTKIPQRTSQARGGTDLQTMFSAQPAEFHSLGALRTQRKQPGTMLSLPSESVIPAGCWGCVGVARLRGRGPGVKERNGEQHGSFGKGGDVQRACGRDRVGRLGDEKVGAEIGISTISCRKWGNRASFLSSTDAQPDINSFLPRTEVMAMSYCSRHCGTLFPIINTSAKSQELSQQKFPSLCFPTPSPI